MVPDLRDAWCKAAPGGSDPSAWRRLPSAERGAAPSMYAVRAPRRRGDDYESRSVGDGRPGATLPGFSNSAARSM
jgi:hypothetical protein